MAYEEGVAERLQDMLVDHPDVYEKKMFGGYMLVGVVGESLRARVGPVAYAAALARFFAREMEFTGRPMKCDLCLRSFDAVPG